MTKGFGFITPDDSEVLNGKDGMSFLFYVPPFSPSLSPNFPPPPPPSDPSIQSLPTKLKSRAKDSACSLRERRLLSKSRTAKRDPPLSTSRERSRELHLQVTTSRDHLNSREESRGIAELLKLVLMALYYAQEAWLVQNVLIHEL
jgi:hypothetical protein